LEQNDPVLKVQDLSVFYAQNEALKQVCLQIETGELVALIGSNGSGKTTLLKAILGLHRSKKGKIVFKERDITQWTVERIVASGIALVPEGRGVLPNMTVAENLELGGYNRKGDISKDLESVLCRFPILGKRRDKPGGTLSGGEQQMLAIARALMAAPMLLMMDEPSLGLAPLVISNLFKIIVEFKQEGFTILLAEQNAKKALGSADRGYVFEMGRIVVEASSQELLRNEAVSKVYLGGN
jgi:branched-chain amino acid transport system ATP-binding protein